MYFLDFSTAVMLPCQNEPGNSIFLPIISSGFLRSGYVSSCFEFAEVRFCLGAMVCWVRFVV